jgi:hypothetical protein
MRKFDYRHDIVSNQKTFVDVMQPALTALAQSGKLGSAELLLFYSYRDQNGIVNGGVCVLFFLLQLHTDDP